MKCNLTMWHSSLLKICSKDGCHIADLEFVAKIGCHIAELSSIPEGGQRPKI